MSGLEVICLTKSEFINKRKIICFKKQEEVHRKCFPLVFFYIQNEGTAQSSILMIL